MFSYNVNSVGVNGHWPLSRLVICLACSRAFLKFTYWKPALGQAREIGRFFCRASFIFVRPLSSGIVC